MKIINIFTICLAVIFESFFGVSASELASENIGLQDKSNTKDVCIVDKIRDLRNGTFQRLKSGQVGCIGNIEGEYIKIINEFLPALIVNTDPIDQKALQKTLEQLNKWRNRLADEISIEKENLNKFKQDLDMFEQSHKQCDVIRGIEIIQYLGVCVKEHQYIGKYNEDNENGIARLTGIPRYMQSMINSTKNDINNIVSAIDRIEIPANIEKDKQLGINKTKLIEYVQNLESIELVVSNIHNLSMCVPSCIDSLKENLQRCNKQYYKIGLDISISIAKFFANYQDSDKFTDQDNNVKNKLSDVATMISNMTAILK